MPSAIHALAGILYSVVLSLRARSWLVRADDLEVPRFGAKSAFRLVTAGLALLLSTATIACGESRTSPAGARGIDTARSTNPANSIHVGGAIARLAFACVGDTRPTDEDDTAAYPTNVVAQIFASIEATAPHPSFVVATGDYVFASNGPSGQAGPQFDLYLRARASFQGPLFPALGNHECTGATSSNCGSEGADGVTANFAAFVEKLLSPLQQADPYYVVRVDGTGGAWTAKFVFVAANAWSSAQSDWLEATLAETTTYTFVVRHEPATATTAPGVLPSEAIMARHPYTLALVGHTHTYRYPASNAREVLVGNGGAPLESKDYGFALFTQRDDGAIVVDMLDWRTREADAEFHFAVNADGTLARP
jgi:hypothetical protein